MVRTKRDFLALNDVDQPTLVKLLERSQELANLWAARRMPQSLTGKRIGLVVNDTGWRNTMAFDLGIQSMGGLCVHAPLRWDTREDLEDLAAYLDTGLTVLSRVHPTLLSYARSPTCREDR
ncbi:MAG: hypothetical protein CBARDMAM_6889 [uncultured Caballeronia sp.]|nr:MAG: hypothetical protein CBARDMAM_6889 [uncultured Caballeronia sp.]